MVFRGRYECHKRPRSHEPSPVPHLVLYIYIISNFICLSDLPSSPFTLSLVPVPPIPASTTYYLQGRYLTPNIGETIPERYPVTDNHDRRLNVQRTRAPPQPQTGSLGLGRSHSSGGNRKLTRRGSTSNLSVLFGTCVVKTLTATPA